MNDKGKGKTPAVTGRTKPPRLLTVGKKTVSSNGRWSNSEMADYIIENASDAWIKIGQLARIGCGSNTIPTKKRVRSRLSQLFMEFLRRDKFLAVDYGDHGAASGVRLADITKAEDRENVEAKLEKMRKRQEMTQERYEQTIRLLNKMAEDASHGRDEGQARGSTVQPDTGAGV